MAGARLLAAFAKAYPNAVFVEIGANDGDKNDHLRPFLQKSGWRGVMVEPVPYVFDRLRHNYGSLERIVLENVAISERDGEAPFFHLRDASTEERSGLPSWYDEIGSFSRETLLRHRTMVPDIGSRIVETSVQTLRFESLCARHQLDHVDLLVVDTEGYDWEILRSVDLNRAAVRLLVYEHYHLSHGDRRACRESLERDGFATMEEGFDTFCLRLSPVDSLTRTWRRLRPGVPGVSALDDS